MKIPYNQSKRRNHQLSAIFCFTRRKKSFSNKFTTVPLYLSALSFLPDLDPKQMVSVPGKSSGSNRIRIYDLQHCIKIININSSGLITVGSHYKGAHDVSYRIAVRKGFFYVHCTCTHCTVLYWYETAMLPIVKLHY